MYKYHHPLLIKSTAKRTRENQFERKRVSKRRSGSYTRKRHNERREKSRVQIRNIREEGVPPNSSPLQFLGLMNFAKKQELSFRTTQQCPLMKIFWYFRLPWTSSSRSLSCRHHRPISAAIMYSFDKVFLSIDEEDDSK